MKPLSPVARRRLILAGVVILAAVSYLYENSKPKQKPIHDARYDSTTGCMTTATREYTGLKLALLTQRPDFQGDSYIESVISERRLEEEYCKKIAGCSLLTPHQGPDNLMLAASFSSCLDDEAKEKNESSSDN